MRTLTCFSLIPFVSLVGALVAVPQMSAQLTPGQPVISVAQSEDGFRASIGEEHLAVSVCGDSVIHVVAAPASTTVNSDPKPWMLDAQQSCPGATFQFARTQDEVTLTTSQLKVAFSLKRGNLTYSRSSGESLLREGDSEPRTYEPVEWNGDHTFRVTDRFSPDTTEGLTGWASTRTECSTIAEQPLNWRRTIPMLRFRFLVSSKG